MGYTLDYAQRFRRRGRCCLQRNCRRQRLGGIPLRLSNLAGSAALLCVDLLARSGSRVGILMAGGAFAYGGKYQMSPALRSSTKVCPSSFMAWTRTLPFITYDHSAALCQCSSR